MEASKVMPAMHGCPGPEFHWRMVDEAPAMTLLAQFKIIHMKTNQPSPPPQPTTPSARPSSSPRSYQILHGDKFLPHGKLDAVWSGHGVLRHTGGKVWEVVADDGVEAAWLPSPFAVSHGLP